MNTSHTTLSLCVIARDNERTIRDCLLSIRPFVDEMIVVDTGSSDRTREVAAELGARVISSTWRDDFSLARNESIEHAAGEWVFWMDTDEVIDAENGQKLRALADAAHPESVWGYLLQVHCHQGEVFQPVVADQVRLFRNRPEIRFEGRIHERILPAIARQQGQVLRADIHVEHGKAEISPSYRAAKLGRNRKLLLMELENEPENSRPLFFLAMNERSAGDHTQTVAYLERYFRLPALSRHFDGKALKMLTASRLALGHLPEAMRACRQGMAREPDDPELLFLAGSIAQKEGRLPEAELHYRSALNGQSPGPIRCCDLGVLGEKTRHNLALVLAYQGRLAEAEFEWRTVTAHHPQFPGAWAGLCDVLWRQEKYHELSELIEGLRAQNQFPALTQGWAERLKITSEFSSVKTL